MRTTNLAILCLGVILLGGTASAKEPHRNGPFAGFPVKIGTVGPIAPDNALQEPFACQVQETALGQPAVDNQAGVGYPVKDSQGNVIGYSANCGAPTRVDYFYRAQGDSEGTPLHPYDPANPPSDVATINIEGRSVPFIVRFERGTINRFIYSIALITPRPDVNNPNSPDVSAWNRDLVYSFDGGVGIGHTQSHNGNALRDVKTPGGTSTTIPLLERGYAVINSTGTATATTYNLVLGGETAAMVKEQFVTEYGQPRYTFGLGGSGGAVQQFIYAQDHPGLLDALIPVEVFPDMITQVNPVGDCELLEYYFDVTDAEVNGTGAVDPLWVSWANRQLIVGLHGVDDATAGTDFGYQFASSADAGSNICVQQWRGAVPVFFNPLFGSYVEGSFQVLDQSVLQDTPLGFFDDLVDIFGVSPGTDAAKPDFSDRVARSTFDNVGVQYGLDALKAGRITVDEFLDLNAHVGGWKNPYDFVYPGFPYLGQYTASNIDPWSARNATAQDYLGPNDVAPRTEGSIAAMHAAYRAGLVFRGNISLPIVDILPYLEPELNEHASRESFAVRQRLIAARGNAHNQVIWGTATDSDSVLMPVLFKALHAETRWLQGNHRPAGVTDACYDADGNLIAAGDSVWSGEVSADGSQVLADTQSGGPCTRAFPIYKDARVAAGENVRGWIFKCATKSVNQALADGTYGNVQFTSAQIDRLREIFGSTGVCDYSQPDQGLPPSM